MKHRKKLARKAKVKAGPSPKPRSRKLHLSVEEDSPSQSIDPSETGSAQLEFVKPRKTKKRPSAPKKRKR
jgi:hypothetical protein